MVPKWTASTDKHGVPRSEAMHAILHASYVATLPIQSGDGITKIYIGKPHPQSLLELEVLVTQYEDGREATIFHVMELGPKFRSYREEYPNEQ